MSTEEEEIIFLQVTPPTPAAVPPTGTAKTPNVANPALSHGEPRTTRISDKFAPEVQHVLRYILQVDLERSDPALTLEEAGIYNGEDLCMFSDKEIKDFNINGKPLKPIYVCKLKSFR